MEKRRKYYGRRLIFWGALALMSWAGYELWARVEAMAGPLRMFYTMAVGERIPPARALTYVDLSIFEVPAYLLCLVLLGLYALICRNRPALGLTVVPPVLLAGRYALVADLPGIGAWQALKLAPMALIALGCLFNAALGLASLRRAREGEKEREREEALEASRPKFHGLRRRLAARTTELTTTNKGG